jgi:hypothetical protein
MIVTMIMTATEAETTIKGGSVETGMNIVLMTTATAAPPDGVKDGKPAGKTADYLPARPKNTVARPTRIRGALTITTRTRLAGS